ncbi:retrovirus-related Pol polyprotein from transposon 297 [Trichonephila clavipes]|nr:retrovirus-related Pol polyprotein from transposon 297 [Trichonephila clavipes]
MLFNLNSDLYPSNVIVLKIFGERIAVCADTGASPTFTGKVIPTKFLLLPEATGNKTLLELDFFNAAGIVIDAQGAKWHFSGNPQKQYKFFKKTSEDIVVSAFELLQNEGKHLSPAQARKLKILLDKNETCFQPGGEPMLFIEHSIDTGDHPPIATFPYRMNPIKKDFEGTDRRTTEAEYNRRVPVSLSRTCSTCS